MRLLDYFLGALLAAGCSYLAVSPETVPFLSYHQTVEARDIQQNGIHSYFVPLGIVSSTFFSADSANLDSNLVVTENGNDLGPAHSPHTEISELGAGRYSHWGALGSTSVIFSSSDNSDPRTNGRIYKISDQRPVPDFLILIVVLPIFVFLLHRISAEIAFGLALVATVSAAWGSLVFGHISISPDSATYLEWSPLVPLGYPLFLGAVQNLSGSPVWVPMLQLIATIGAIIFLSLAVRSINRVAGTAILLVLLSYTPLLSTETGLLSEAAFLPLLTVNAGAALFLIAEPKIRYAVLLSLTAALIMFVRPAGYFAPLGVIFLVIAGVSRFRWMINWAIGPMIAFTLAMVLVNLAVRGTTTQSQIGRVLFPHAAFLFEPQFANEQDRKFAAAIYDALESHRRRYQQASSLEERFALSTNDYNPRLLDTDSAIYRQIALEPNSQSDEKDDFHRINAIYLRLFESTILHKPLDYLLLVRDQLVGAWLSAIFFLPNGSFAKVYLAEAAFNYSDSVKLVRGRKLNIGEDALKPNLSAINGWPGRIIGYFDTIYRRIQVQRWLAYTTGIVRLLGIPISAFVLRQSKCWLALGYCGVIIHGSVLLTAAVTVFIPRYGLPVYLMILLAGVIMVSGSLSWVVRTAKSRVGKSGSNPAVPWIGETP